MCVACTKFPCIVIFLQGLAKDPNILSQCLYHLGRNLWKVLVLLLSGCLGMREIWNSVSWMLQVFFSCWLWHKRAYFGAGKLRCSPCTPKWVKFHNRGSASSEKKHSFTENIGWILQWVGWYGMVSSFCHSANPQRRTKGK